MTTATATATATNTTTTQRYVDEEDEFLVEEGKQPKVGSSLRQETEFFDDDSYVIHDIINVRYTETKNYEEWEILKNKRSVLELKGIKFSKKERDFFRSPEGMLFIVNGYKLGWKSVLEFKRQLKKILK